MGKGKRYGKEFELGATVRSVSTKWQSIGRCQIAVDGGLPRKRVGFRRQGLTMTGGAPLVPSSAVQTWHDWYEAGYRGLNSFPNETNCREYIPIAEYRGMSIKQAYKSTGASRSTRNHGVNIRDHGDDPTPTMIRKACRRIQDGWTEIEELQRRTGSAMARSLPTDNTGERPLTPQGNGNHRRTGSLVTRHVSCNVVELRPQCGRRDCSTQARSDPGRDRYPRRCSTVRSELEGCVLWLLPRVCSPPKNERFSCRLPLQRSTWQIGYLTICL